MSLEMRMTGRARQVDKSDRRTRSIQFRIEAGRGRRGKGQDRRCCYRGVFLRRQKRDGDEVEEVEPKRQVGNQRWKPPVERLIPVEGIRSNMEEVDAELAVAESAYGVGGRPTDLEREVFARWRIGAVRIPCGRGIVA